MEAFLIPLLPPVALDLAKQNTPPQNPAPGSPGGGPFPLWWTPGDER